MASWSSAVHIAGRPRVRTNARRIDPTGIASAHRIGNGIGIGIGIGIDRSATLRARTPAPREDAMDPCDLWIAVKSATTFVIRGFMAMQSIIHHSAFIIRGSPMTLECKTPRTISRLSR
jgi:hypothetical protein